MHKHTLHDRQWQAPWQRRGKKIRIPGYAWKAQWFNTMVLLTRKQKTGAGCYTEGGSDIARFSDWHDGSIRIGLMTQYGTSSGNNEDEVSRSSHSVKGYSAGIYSTWFGHNDPQTGPYIDTWLMHGQFDTWLMHGQFDTWLMHGQFDNDVTGQGQHTESYRLHNTTMSIEESGYKLKMTESPTARYYLEPQAQIIYSLYRAKDHITASGSTASGSVASDMSDNSATTQLGVLLYADRLTVRGSALCRQAGPKWPNVDAGVH
ncbi:MAG: autotransporter outer membrane beta-barrel domain-containing protein [Symbiopectobacterium sp.]